MKKVSNRSTLSRLLLKLDIFGQKPELQVDGESCYPTWNGFFVSFVIVIITLFYGNEKFNKMISYDDTNYKQVIEPDAIDRETIFEASEFDANVAFYLTDASTPNYEYLTPDQYQDYLTLSVDSYEIDISNPDLS